MRKINLSIIFILAALGCIYLLYSYESPSYNYNSKLSIIDCIKLNERVLHFEDFTVRYIENSTIDCVNPYFPSISINFRKKHNAWLHIVRTNSENYRVFIDSVDKNEYPKLYPFYQKLDNPYSEFAGSDNNFYDAPLWTYRIWHPEVEWIGHAYPVNVNYQLKVVSFYQGIRWSFKFGNYRLHPIAIKPTVVGKDAVECDWNVFKSELDGYKIVIIE